MTDGRAALRKGADADKNGLTASSHGLPNGRSAHYPQRYPVHEAVSWVDTSRFK